MKYTCITFLIFAFFKSYAQCNLNVEYDFDANVIGRGYDVPLLNKGKKFKIVADGNFICSFSNNSKMNATPQGGACQNEFDSSQPLNHFLYPDLPCWSLLGQIGDGKVFFVGTNYEGVADQTAPIKLFVNCRVGWGYSFVNVQGHWKVKLTNVEEEQCPQLYAGYDMASVIDANNGYFPYSVEDCINKYPDAAAIAGGLYFEKTTPNGHTYLAINPLGSFNMSVADMVRTLDAHIGQIFPGGKVDYTVSGSTVYNTTIIKNHQYSLVAKKWWNLYYPRVTVTEVSDFHFTFTATPHHILYGTAIHGIFEDNCGNFYMFQQGKGPVGEPKFNQSVNKLGAYFMWLSMAENMREYLANGRVLTTPL